MLTRGSSLSDDRVIAYINQNYIPIEVNITDSGFPDDVPALRVWQRAFKGFWQSKFAFATSVAITPDGSLPLGSSGSGFKREWQTAINYHPDLYLGFLKDSLSRYNQICETRNDTSLNPMQKEMRMLSIYKDTYEQISYAYRNGGWHRK